MFSRVYSCVRAARDLYQRGSVEKRAVGDASGGINVGPAWNGGKQKPEARPEGTDEGRPVRR